MRLIHNVVVYDDTIDKKIILVSNSVFFYINNVLSHYFCDSDDGTDGECLLDTLRHH